MAKCACWPVNLYLSFPLHSILARGRMYTYVGALPCRLPPQRTQLVIMDTLTQSTDNVNVKSKIPLKDGGKMH